MPSLFRKVGAVTTRSERLELEDGDFLDLEWADQGRDRVAILSHGLEGSARAAYIQGMARTLEARGWDVVAWNCRGCSGEMNRLARFYHSGASEDLAAVVDHVLAVHPARKVDLVGFSLGGNMSLKYLGERGGDVSGRLHRAVTFSVPCDLACSSRELSTYFNRKVYMKRFIGSLADKVRAKQSRFPDLLDPSGLSSIATFKEFDDRYTAPLHGFKDAEDYWARSSARGYLSGISVPTLLVNASNDPFLGDGCYPTEEAEASGWVFLEIPEGGGHVGFGGIGSGENWAEKRAVEFLGG